MCSSTPLPPFFDISTSNILTPSLAPLHFSTVSPHMPPFAFLPDFDSACAVLAQLLSCIQLFTTPWTVACQAPGSMGILQVRITGVGSLSLLQGNFVTQELIWGLLHCRRILHHLSYQGSPWFCINHHKHSLAKHSLSPLSLCFTCLAKPQSWISPTVCLPFSLPVPEESNIFNDCKSMISKTKWILILPRSPID